MTGSPISAATSHTFSVLTSTPATAVDGEQHGVGGAHAGSVSVKKMP